MNFDEILGSHLSISSAAWRGSHHLDAGSSQQVPEPAQSRKIGGFLLQFTDSMRKYRLLGVSLIECPAPGQTLQVTWSHFIIITNLWVAETYMNMPIKHHFIPAFSLKPWVGEDGKVCSMQKISDNISPLRVHPDATGFKRNLYRTDQVGREQEQHLEKRFFGRVDEEASRALRKIRGLDRSTWDDANRLAWSRYLISLMFRTPESVAFLKKHVNNMWNEITDASEPDYLKIRTSTDPATLAEYAALKNHAIPQITATNLLMQTIDNPELGTTIINMHWWSVPLPRANVDLLYSDRPIVRPLSLAHPGAFLAIPVAPKMLFIAAREEGFAKKIYAMRHTDFVKRINKTVVAQAREFVWGLDDRQLGFVQKHMGSVPEQNPLTAEQEAEAIRISSGRSKDSSVS